MFFPLSGWSTLFLFIAAPLKSQCSHQGQSADEAAGLLTTFGLQN